MSALPLPQKERMEEGAAVASPVMTEKTEATPVHFI